MASRRRGDGRSRPAPEIPRYPALESPGRSKGHRCVERADRRCSPSWSKAFARHVHNSAPQSVAARSQTPAGSARCPDVAPTNRSQRSSTGASGRTAAAG